MSTPVPEAVESIYASEINEPIQLFSGEGSITNAGTSRAAPSEIRFTWTPNEGPEVETRGLFVDLNSSMTIDVPRLGLTAPLLGRSATFGTHEARFRGLLTGAVQFGEPSALTRLVFHIANFPFVYGDPVKRGSRLVRGRIRLEAAPWVVTIDPVVDERESGAPDLPSRLKEVRGYGITHVGQLTRSDAHAFSANQAEDILEDVGRTLSLARAAFSMPFLRVGFNAMNERVWECWTGFRTEAWRSHENWFDRLEPKVLQSVFSGWRSHANTPQLEVLDAALHLYINAHAPGLATESRLVLAQAALEGLADGWPHPPLPGSSPLPTFGSGAAARVAVISQSLQLPVDVPPILTNLAALDRPAANSPALDKVAWVRNSIAHLQLLPRLAAHPSLVRFEARQFATQHLELALLRMLSAEGMYRDRLDPASRTQRLPWL
jgi:hypothetical protein